MSLSSPLMELNHKKEKHVRQNSSGHSKNTDNIIRQASENKNNLDRNKIKLGVCAMEKKTSCKPMQEILNRIVSFGDIQVIVFPEPIILYAPIQVDSQYLHSE